MGGGGRRGGEEKMGSERVRGNKAEGLERREGGGGLNDRDGDRGESGERKMD